MTRTMGRSRKVLGEHLRGKPWSIESLRGRNREGCHYILPVQEEEDGNSSGCYLCFKATRKSGLWIYMSV